MKRLLSVILAFVFVIGICASAPMTIKANAASISDLELELDEESNTYTIVDCPEAVTGDLVIPRSYNGKIIKEIAAYAFAFCYNLTSVEIPGSIRKIGEYAFTDCYNIKTVKLAEGTENLGEGAFYGCKELKEIVIPSTIKRIGPDVFFECVGLKRVVIPKSVTSIDCSAFDDYDGILFEDVYYAGTQAEWNAIEITDEYDNAEYIARTLNNTRHIHYNSVGNHSTATVTKEATCGNRGMIQYSCPCGFTSKEFIEPTGEHDFDSNGVCVKCSVAKANCVETAHPYNKAQDFVKVIEIPGADRINITFSEDCEIYYEQYLMLIGDNDYELFLYSNEMAGKTFVIPGDTVKLQMYGCENSYGDDEYDEDYYGIKVTSVEQFWYACPHNDTKVEAGWEANCSCAGYEGDYYCYDCGVTYEGQIYDRLPHNFVNDICTKCESHLWDIFTEDDMTSAFVYGYNGDEKTVTVPSTYENKPVTEIFYWGNSETENVTLPRTVTTISYRAFYGCSSLKNISIPDSVKSIESKAFQSCPSLSSVTIPSSVKTIGEKAFGYDSNNNKVPLFKIFGETGSAAQKYASDNGFDFIGSTPVPVKLQIPVVKTANTAKGIKVTWNKIAGAQKYVVYQRIYNAKTKTWSGWKVVKNTTGLSYVDTTTKIGTYYSYTVRAVNGASKSSVKATKGLKYDVKPTVTVANASNGIKVSWSTVANATGYTVYSSTYNAKTKKWSGWKNRGTTKANAKSWVDKSAKAGTVYKYTVRARYGSAASSFVASASLVRLLNPTVKVAKASNGIKVTWNKIAGAKNYKVYRATYANGKWSGWSAIKTTDNKTFAFTDKTAKKGVYYKYTVRAVNGKSASAFTASKNVKR